MTLTKVTVGVLDIPSEFRLSQYSNLAAALTAMGSTHSILLVDQDETLSADATIASTTTFTATPGAVLTVATAKTLTINGPISVPSGQQVFTVVGTGRVDLEESLSGLADSSWFGSKQNGSGTIDAYAINQAISSRAGRALVPGGRYNIEEEIDFTPWSTIQNTNVIGLSFEAAGTKFVASVNLTQMIRLNPTDAGQIHGHRFCFGRLDGDKDNRSVSRIVYARYLNNCKIEILRIENGSSTGLFIDQDNSPAFGCFNNLWEIGDLVDHTGTGMVTDAATTGTEGVEGNIFTIARIGNNGGDGIRNGNLNNSRVIFNTFVLGPIESNGGFGLYERGGGNIWIINNTNSNDDGGLGCNGSLLKRSTFIGAFEDGMSGAIATEHLVLDNTAENSGYRSGYNENHITMADFHLWVDSDTGFLRIKDGKPSTATDGAIVATQT